MTSDLWESGCDALATQLPEQQFNTWIRPLPPAQIVSDSPDGMVLCLRAPNRFKLDWIRSQYASRIEATLSELAGKPVRLELALALRDASPREGAQRVLAQAAQVSRAATAHDLHHLGNVLPSLAGSGAAANGPHHAAASQGEPGRPDRSAAPAASRHKLNTALTFDNLVAGRANQMARTAALHVAGAPGQMYILSAGG